MTGYMTSEVLKVAKISFSVFWIVTPRGFGVRFQRFVVTNYLHPQG